MPKKQIDAIDVLRMVRKYLQNFPIDNITFTVEESGITSLTHGWRVVICASHLPERMSPYYEELAIIEEDIAEKEGVNVLFTTGRPQNLLAEVA
jgi:hypothetical protein